MEESRDIGWLFPNNVLSYFLYKGITLAILSLSGNVPVHNDWLIIMLSGRDTTFSISFSNLVEMLSHPALDLGLKFRMFV